CRTAVSGDGTRDPYSRPTNSKTTALATIVAAINSRCRIGWADNRIMAAALPAFPDTLLDGRIDLRWPLPDLVDLQRAGLLAGHPRSALGHTWERDAGDLRLFGEQAVDAFDRDVTADDVAADQRDVAGLQAVQDAVFL